MPTQTFRVMPVERQRECARRGGVSAHARGVAHQWTKEEAQAAGRLGGIASAKAKHERAQARLLDALAGGKGW